MNRQGPKTPKSIASRIGLATFAALALASCARDTNSRGAIFSHDESAIILHESRAHFTTPGLLGDGFNSLNGESSDQCVKGEPKLVGQPTLLHKLSKPLNSAQIHELMGFNEQADPHKGWFQEATVLEEFVSNSLDVYRRRLIFALSMRGLSLELAKPKANRVSAQSIRDLAKSGMGCGDGYISRVDLGADLIVRVDLAFSNLAEAERMTKQLELYSLARVLQKLTESGRNQNLLDASIRVVQLGGNDQDYLAFAGSLKDTLIACSAQLNPGSCDAFNRNLLEYANAPRGLIDQVKDTTESGSQTGYQWQSYVDTTTTTEKSEKLTLLRQLAVRSLELRELHFGLGNVTNEITLPSFVSGKLPDQSATARTKLRTISINTDRCWRSLDNCTTSDLKSLLSPSLAPVRPSLPYFFHLCHRDKTTPEIHAILDFFHTEECDEAAERLAITTTLSLQNKGLTSLDFLMGQDQLTELDVANNDISSLSPLKLMRGIKTINTAGNPATTGENP